MICGSRCTVTLTRSGRTNAAWGDSPVGRESIYGLTRAAAGSGDWPAVRRAATAFLDLWASADQDQEELEVVREYLQRANRLYPLRDAGLHGERE